MSKGKGVRKGRYGPVINKPLFEIEAAGYKTPCWMWKRLLTSTKIRGGGGYAFWRRKGHSTVNAHKQMWIWANGPVPAGLELDHLCRNRACVRPDHLEPVTHQENVRRGLSNKYSDEVMDACVARALIIGVKPAARESGMTAGRLNFAMRAKGLRSPLSTGRQRKVCV